MKKLYFEKVKKYCVEKGYSLDKLALQQTFLIYDNFIVAQPVKLPKHDGLRTDLATQPKPTLIYDITSDKITETEYTNIYLK